MNSNKQITEQEVLQLILCGLFYRNNSIITTLKPTLCTLTEMFDFTNDKTYLEIGYTYVRSYINLGFKYSDLTPEADNVLKKLDLKPCIEFPKGLLGDIHVPLTRSRLNKMIGRWPASIYNSHKKNDVISDIITKIVSRQFGKYTYYTSSDASKSKAAYYILIVTSDNAFFHDINKRRFYLIETPDSIH